MKRTHDTAADVANAVGCSVGVVAESAPWKLNQERLKDAKLQQRDPKAIPLDERAVNAAGGNPAAQLREHRRTVDARDDEIDQKEKELLHQIGEYRKGHPDEAVQTVARALGCMACDVERRDAELEQLIDAQKKSEMEDRINETGHGTSKEWVEKQV